MKNNTSAGKTEPKTAHSGGSASPLTEANTESFGWFEEALLKTLKEFVSAGYLSEQQQRGFHGRALLHLEKLAGLEKQALAQGKKYVSRKELIDNLRKVKEQRDQFAARIRSQLEEGRRGAEILQRLKIEFKDLQAKYDELILEAQQRGEISQNAAEEIRSLGGLVDSLREENETLAGENSDLRNALKQMEEEQLLAAGEFSSLQQDLEESKIRVAELEAKLEEAARAQNEQENKIRELEALRQSALNVETQREEERAAREEQSLELRGLREESARLEEEHEKLRADIMLLEENASAMHAELAGRGSQIESLRESLRKNGESGEKQRLELEQKLNAARAEFRGLDETLQVHRKEAKSAREKLEQELQQARILLGEADADLQNFKRNSIELEKFRALQTKFRLTSRRLKTGYDRAKGIAFALSDKLKALEADRQIMLAELDSLRGDRKESEREDERLRLRIEQLSHEKESLRFELDQRGLEAGRLEHEIADRDRQREELRARLNQQQAEYRDGMEALRGDLEISGARALALEEELAKTRAEKQGLESRLSSSARENSDQRKRMEELDARVAKLMKEFGEKQDQIARQRAEYELLGRELEDLKADNRSLEEQLSSAREDAATRRRHLTELREKLRLSGFSSPAENGQNSKTPENAESDEPQLREVLNQFELARRELENAKVQNRKLAEEGDELRKRIGFSENEIQTLRESLGVHEQNSLRLEEEFAKLHSEAEGKFLALEAHRNSLQESLSALKSEAGQVARDLEFANQNRAELTSELESALERNLDIEKNLLALDQREKELLETLKSKDEMLKSWEKKQQGALLEAEALAGTLALLEEERDSLVREKESMKAGIADFWKRFEDKDREWQTLQSRLESERAEHKEALKNLEQVASEAKGESSQLRWQVENFRNREFELNSQNESLSSRIRILEKENAQISAREEEIRKAELGSLQEQLARREEELARSGAELASVKEKSKERLLKLYRTKKLAAKFSESLKFGALENKNLSEKIKELETRASQTQILLEQARQTGEEIRARLEGAERERDALLIAQADGKNTEARLEGENAGFKQELAKLRAELDEAARQFEENRRQWHKAVKLCRILKAKEKKAQRDVEKLARAFQELKNAHDVLSAKAAESEEALKTLTAELTTLRAKQEKETAEYEKTLEDLRQRNALLEAETVQTQSARRAAETGLEKALRALEHREKELIEARRSFSAIVSIAQDGTSPNKHNILPVESFASAGNPRGEQPNISPNVELHHLEKRRNDLVGELRRLEASTLSMQSNPNFAEQKVAELENQAASLQNELDSWQTMLDRHGDGDPADAKRIRQTMDEAKHRLAEIRRERGDWENGKGVESARLRIRDHKIEIQTLEQEISRARKHQRAQKTETGPLGRPQVMDAASSGYNRGGNLNRLGRQS